MCGFTFRALVLYYAWLLAHVIITKVFYMIRYEPIVQVQMLKAAIDKIVVA